MLTKNIPHRTRLAPSPTGHLHLGHVLHLLYVQGLARKLKAQVCFRLEDHDLSRCRPQFEQSLLEDLSWLGVDIPPTPWRQSDRHAVYHLHLENLMSRGLIYACICSRKEIHQVTGQTSGELHYPGTCRQKNYPLDTEGASLRLKITDASASHSKHGLWTFHDFFAGVQSGDPNALSGDVVIRDRLRQWTYQYAVVIDDLEQGIDLIIRGEDLLSSTTRQLAMREIISPGAATPYFAHHPLLRDQTGEKLAKRRLSEGVASLREQGFSASEVRGRAAYLGGLIQKERAVDLGENPVQDLKPKA